MSFTGTFRQVRLQGNPPRFATPDFLFATKASDSSNRPVETITPLSAALRLVIDAKHPDDDHAKVAADILTHAKYAGKIVLVCWHHGTIPDLAEKLGIDDPPAWPGAVYDRVWRISYASGVASLEDLPQMLLYGDSSR
jgi:hypothetical protein